MGACSTSERELKQNERQRLAKLAGGGDKSAVESNAPTDRAQISEALTEDIKRIQSTPAAGRHLSLAHRPQANAHLPGGDTQKRQTVPTEHTAPPKPMVGGTRKTAPQTTARSARRMRPGIARKIEREQASASSQPTAVDGPCYTVWSPTACTKYYGESWATIAMLRHGNFSYMCRDSDEVWFDKQKRTNALQLPDGALLDSPEEILSNLSGQCSLQPKASQQAAATQLMVAAGKALQDIAKGESKRINRWVAHFSGELTVKYFMGQLAPTVVDFVIYPVLRAALEKKGNTVELPANLEQWIEYTMPDLPAVAQMNNSGVGVLPE